MVKAMVPRLEPVADSRRPQATELSQAKRPAPQPKIVAMPLTPPQPRVEFLVEPLAD